MIPLSFEPTGSRGNHWLKKVARGREPKHTTTCEHPCTKRTKCKYANANMRLPAFPLSSLSSLPTALHPIWQTENLNICTQRYINEAINIGHFHHFNLSSKTLNSKKLTNSRNFKIQKNHSGRIFPTGQKKLQNLVRNKPIPGKLYDSWYPGNIVSLPKFEKRLFSSLFDGRPCYISRTSLVPPLESSHFLNK